MLDKWEEFKAGPAQKPGKRLYVSLNHKGQFLLNHNVLKAMGEPAAMVLYFAKNSSKIGMRAASKIMPQAFPVLPRAAARSKMIQASSFCRHHGIKVKGTVSFTRLDIDNDGMLILNLENMYRVSRVKS